MNQVAVVDKIQNLPRGTDFSDRIDLAIQRSKQTNRPFFIVILQIDNLQKFAKKRPRYVVMNLFKELFSTFRGLVHPSQFIGGFQNGFGFVFDSVESSQVDQVAKKLVSVGHRVIRDGRYNDLASRWTDILYDFLFPGKPYFIHPKVGWAFYPRDGQNARDLLKRSLFHLEELNK